MINKSKWNTKLNEMLKNAEKDRKEENGINKAHIKVVGMNSETLCLPGSSVHGIFQARVLEWGDIAFSGRYFRNP